MFDLAPLAIGIKERSGPSQWLAEAVATFALVLTILGGLRFTPTAIPWLVGLVITAAYWFTASTSFVFDQHGVSFVSVTQQFNTTTSLTALTPAQLRTEWRRL
jgi:hypothetical protein